jgi:hypothetical protein
MQPTAVLVMRDRAMRIPHLDASYHARRCVLALRRGVVALLDMLRDL